MLTRCSLNRARGTYRYLNADFYVEEKFRKEIYLSALMLNYQYFDRLKVFGKV